MPACLENPLITVIIPAYNAAATIGQSIDSVVAQTYPHWELLVIDDCSQDETRKVLKTIQDPRVTILQNAANLGVAATRNRGVREAHGNWIAFLDSDDYWDKDKLAKQVSCLHENPDAKLLYTGVAFIDGDGHKRPYVMRVPSRVTYKQLLVQNQIPCSSTMVRRDLLLKYPMPEQQLIHEDFVVWLQILREVPYAFGVDEPLLIYRITDSSKSGNKFRAAGMNWNVYRYIRLPWLQAVVCMFVYTIRGLKKHYQMRKRA